MMIVVMVMIVVTGTPAALSSFSFYARPLQSQHNAQLLLRLLVVGMVVLVQMLPSESCFGAMTLLVRDLCLCGMCVFERGRNNEPRVLENTF